MFVILTDGKENASREFKKAQIVQMIQDCQEKNGWHFTFLSTDLEAINDAADYGIRRASMLHYDKSAMGMRAAYGSASRSVSDLRSGKARDVRYHDEERRVQEDLRKKKVRGE